MMEYGKVIILIGLVLVIVGVLVLLFGKFTSIGRLPGDIFIKNGNFNFYFPLTTCILLSVFLSLIMFFISRK